MDVGSNIGYYTIIGGAINKNLKIIAFEPSDAAFKYVKKNIIINGQREFSKILISDFPSHFCIMFRNRQK